MSYPKYASHGSGTTVSTQCILYGFNLVPSDPDILILATLFIVNEPSHFDVLHLHTITRAPGSINDS